MTATITTEGRMKDIDTGDAWKDAFRESHEPDWFLDMHSESGPDSAYPDEECNPDEEADESHIVGVSPENGAWLDGLARAAARLPLGVLPAHESLREAYESGYQYGRTAIEADHPNDFVRCECPALEPYPPSGWMGLERWETLLHLADFPGVQVDGCNVWVPDDIGYEVSFKVGFQCDKFRTAFTAGEWYLLGTRHN